MFFVFRRVRIVVAIFSVSSLSFDVSLLRSYILLHIAISVIFFGCVCMSGHIPGFHFHGIVLSPTRTRGPSVRLYILLNSGQYSLYLFMCIWFLGVFALYVLMRFLLLRIFPHIQRYILLLRISRLYMRSCFLFLLVCGGEM